MRTIPFVFLFLFSSGLALGDSSGDENHWLKDHQGLDASTSKGVNRKLDKAVKSLCAQISKGAGPARESVAVSEFLTADNQITMLGKILSIKLVHQLAKTRKFIPVDRDFTFLLTKEMKLGMSGLIEDKTVQNAGRFLGASKVLIGTIGTIGDEMVIDARLIKTESSQVLATAETSFKSNPSVSGLLARKIELEPAPPPAEQKTTAAAAPRESDQDTDPSHAQAQKQKAVWIFTEGPHEGFYKLNPKEEELEKIRKIEDAAYYRNREEQLKEVDVSIAAMNVRAANERREREAKMDREANEAWDRTKKYHEGLNRHRVIVFTPASQRLR